MRLVLSGKAPSFTALANTSPIGASGISGMEPGARGHAIGVTGLSIGAPILILYRSTESCGKRVLRVYPSRKKIIVCTRLVRAPAFGLAICTVSP